MGIRFALYRFRSPLLTVSLVISFPAGTRMFRSPAFPFLTEQSEDYEVALGHRRIIGSLHLPDAYRSLARPSSAPEPSHSPGGVANAAGTVGLTNVQVAYDWYQRTPRDLFQFPRGSSSTSPKRVALRVHEHFSLRPSTWLERVSPPIIEGIFKHYPYGISVCSCSHSPTSRVEPATTVPLYNGFLSQPVVGCYHRSRRCSFTTHSLLIRFSALPILCILSQKESLTR